MRHGGRTKRMISPETNFFVVYSLRGTNWHRKDHDYKDLRLLPLRWHYMNYCPGIQYKTSNETSLHVLLDQPIPNDNFRHPHSASKWPRVRYFYVCCINMGKHAENKVSPCPRAKSPWNAYKIQRFLRPEITMSCCAWYLEIFAFRKRKPVRPTWSGLKQWIRHGDIHSNLRTCGKYAREVICGCDVQLEALSQAVKSKAWSHKVWLCGIIAPFLIPDVCTSIFASASGRSRRKK